MTTTSTHDPNKVVVTVGGVPLVGLQKDTFVEISHAGPTVTMRQSLQGDTVYSVQRAMAATVTLRVERNSPANSLLSQFDRIQRTTGAGEFVFAIIDANVPDGTAKFTCPAARVEKMPDQAFAAEAAEIEWTILCGSCEHFITELPASSALPI